MDTASKIKNYSLVLIALIIVGNIILLDYFFVRQRSDLLDFQTRLTQLSDSFKLIGSRVFNLPATETLSAPAGKELVAQYVCPQSCVSLISEATKSATRQSVVAPSSQPAAPSTSSKEFFIPLGSGTLAQINIWTDMNSVQGSFNTDNYPTIKSAFFEASLRTSGSGQVQARLYDTTTPAVFWDAQLTSTSTTGEYFSKPIKLYTGGAKTYRVQMSTSISTAYIDQARIHIVTQ